MKTNVKAYLNRCLHGIGGGIPLRSFGRNIRLSTVAALFRALIDPGSHPGGILERLLRLRIALDGGIQRIGPQRLRHPGRFPDAYHLES